MPWKRRRRDRSRRWKALAESPPLLIYEQDKPKVLQALQDGRVEYADLTEWAFLDLFMGFLQATQFLEWAVGTYPDPRQRHSVPVGVLLASVLQLKYHGEAAFLKLPYVLRSGSILQAVGVNARMGGGFNRKHKKPRRSPFDQDTARKYFKDTDPQRLQAWYTQDVGGWLQAHQALERERIFVLDSSLLTLPDNPRYEQAAQVPLDEQGQYATHGTPTWCYQLTNLLHVSTTKDYFLFTGVRLGPGSASGLTEGKRLVTSYVAARGCGAIRLLLIDRGFVDGAFITWCKEDQQIDVVVPLKSSMAIMADAAGLAGRPEHPWQPLRMSAKEEQTLLRKEAAVCEELTSWEECKVPLTVVLVRETAVDGTVQQWALTTTLRGRTAQQLVELYRLRSQIEERYDQLKNAWGLTRFTSTAFSLVTAHVVFTLLAYSLLQLYLKRRDLRALAVRTITTLQYDEQLGRAAVIVYADGAFAVFGLLEYQGILLRLSEVARRRLLRRTSALIRNRSP